MKIIETKVLKGPNFWSVKKTKLVVMKLDLENLEEQPTNEIPGFYERIQAKIPSLYQHYCSEGVPGGFFERVKSGTWMGHVIEHIALEIQSLAGMNVGFGRTRSTATKGIYHVVIAYEVEEAGRYAAHAAVSIADALINKRKYDIEKDIAYLKKINNEQNLGPSTSAIVEAATARGIPSLRLGTGSLVQLGYGCNQKRINGTISSYTNCIAVDIAGDKNQTKELLKAVNKISFS